MYVVETQRTRSGKKKKKGKDTEPEIEAAEVLTGLYSIRDFDVLAVCLQPLTRSWTDFMFCTTRDLVVRSGASHLLEVLQPTYMDESHGWTRNFAHAVVTFRAAQSSG